MRTFITWTHPIIHPTPIAEFVEFAPQVPVVDVRAPVEFEQGHFPGAINIPLFDNDERAEIGTRYRKNGKEAAIQLGYKYADPKRQSLIDQALAVTDHQDHKRPEIRLHCWRGGMRSAKVAELLESDLNVHLLEGGYKSYRRYAQEIFQRTFPIIVLSGLTGAGKTRQIHLLQKLGQQVVDLEGMANHRGSAFGGIQQGAQPTTEQFENNLAMTLLRMDSSRVIWVEDESNRVGKVVIPPALFKQINGGPGIFMDVDRSVRADLAEEDYGELDQDEMVAAIERITKKLGGQHAKAAIEAIRAGNNATCCEILLDYYDRLYKVATSRNSREILNVVKVKDPRSEEGTKLLIAEAESMASCFSL